MSPVQQSVADPCCFWPAQVTFLLLLAYFRPRLYLVLEQPVSSWLPKQISFLEVICRWKLERFYTVLGSFGHDLIKPTHLYSNLPTMVGIERRATKHMKEKHRQRMKKKHLRLLAKGQKPKSYVVFEPNGSFHGGKDLAEAAIYPQRFATGVFKCWKQKHNSN